MAWLWWGLAWRHRFLIFFRIFLILDSLLKMFLVESLFIAVMLNFLLKTSFVVLNIEIDVKLSLEILSNNMSWATNTILKEVFYDSIGWKFVYKNHLFLLGRIYFREGDFHLVWTKISVICQCEVTVLASIITFQSLLVKITLRNLLGLFSTTWNYDVSITFINLEFVKALNAFGLEDEFGEDFRGDSDTKMVFIWFSLRTSDRLHFRSLR